MLLCHQKYMSKFSFRKLAMIGLGSEKDFLVENLSVLLNSGMDVLASLRAIAEEVRSSRLKKRIFSRGLAVNPVFKKCRFESREAKA